MRTLLVAINAKYIHSNLAIYSLRAYAQKMGHEVDMAEFTINQQTEYMLKEIYKRAPEFIGFSCYIWNIQYVKALATEVKKVLPDCRIWLGGPEVSFDLSNVLLQNPYADGIMIGEGEITFSNVIEAYENKTDMSKVSGIALREPFVINPQTEYINMDDIPFPYKNFKDMEHRIIYYESSRGCPYSCSYCLSSVDKKVRYRSMELVKKELKVFLDAKVPQVKFVDRTFNCDRKRTKQIWQYLIKNDNGITNFHFEISADIITDEEIGILKKMRPGLVQLEIGVQTTNETTVKAIKRKMNFNTLSKIVKKIHEPKNVHQHLDLIAGLPYEDYASFGRSFNDVYSLRPQQLQLGFLKVLKGSYMWESAKNENIIYGSLPPYEVLSTPWLSYGDVLKLKGIEEMVEVYYNSGQFNVTLEYMQRYFDTPFEMYEYLADYYEKNGYSDCGQARITRYQILLEAMKDKTECMEEVLVHDLYHRENMKTRPAFASNFEDYKKAYHQFYTDEELIRRLLPKYGEFNTKQIERMTHIEHYSIDMMQLMNTHDIVNKDVFYLYDYRDVSRVDENAAVIDVTDEVMKKYRMLKILELFDKEYTREYKCYLNHDSAWQLLIATILSAQCTDERVNVITKDLFVKYRDLQAFADANLSELEQDIKSAGFYHNKAVNIISCAKDIVEKYDGQVPSDLDKLTALAGVGRKTANVIRGNIYNIPSIVVDTHVKRISRKLGFTTQTDPEKIEFELMKLLPKDHWILYNIHVIRLGRTICVARRPDCENCFLKEWCPKIE